MKLLERSTKLTEMVLGLGKVDVIVITFGGSRAGLLAGLFEKSCAGGIVAAILVIVVWRSNPDSWKLVDLVAR